MSFEVETYVYDGEDLELCAIGVAVVSDSARDTIYSSLEPKHFYNPCNALLFELMKEMYSSGVVPDYALILKELELRGMTQKVGGAERFWQTCRSGSRSSATDYCVKLKRLWQLRESEVKLKEINDALNSVGPLESRLASAQNIVTELDSLLMTETKFSPYVLGTGDLSTIAAGSGIATPWEKINRKVFPQYGGIPKGAYALLVAYRGVGKTLMALNMIIHAAKNGVPVLFLSLEMPAAQIERRVMKMITGSEELPVADDIFDDNNDKWESRRSELAGWNIEVIAPPSADISEIVSCVKAWNRKHPEGMVVIDYVQLIENRTEKLREYALDKDTAGKLGRLARSMPGVVTVCLSQFSETADGRGKTKGGSVWEEPATFVMVLHRDDKREEFYQLDVDAAHRYFIGVITKVRLGPGDGAKILFSRPETNLTLVEDTLSHEEMKMIYGEPMRRK